MSWAEELLPAAASRSRPLLARLYAVASLCLFSGRSDDAITYARRAAELGANEHSDEFARALGRSREASAHHFEGRLDVALQTVTDLAGSPGPMQIAGLCSQSQILTKLGRPMEAMPVADASLAAAEERGNPFWISFALHSVGLAYRSTDPERALHAFERGVTYAEEHRVPHFGTIMAVNAARIEATDGDIGRALEPLAAAIDALHRCGDVANVAFALSTASMAFFRLGDAAAATTMLGAITDFSNAGLDVPEDYEDQLRSLIGEDAFRHWIEVGSAMELGESVRYALDHLRAAAAERRPR